MRRLLILLLVVTTTLTACSFGGGEVPIGLPTTATSDTPDDVVVVGAGRTLLRPFDSCDDALRYYTDIAAELVTPYGLGGGVGFAIEETAAEAADSAGGFAPPALPAAVDNDVSGTNVQEVGVDEPDLVKTDGDIIVTAVTGQVRVLDVATEQVVATIPTPRDTWQHELLLSGRNLVILSSGAAPIVGPVAIDDAVGDVAFAPAFQPERVTVTRVDLSDPRTPVVRDAIRLEGSYRSARMIDGTIRLVTVSNPTGLAFTSPRDGSLGAEQEALEANRRVIQASDLDDWVPHLQPLGADGQPAGEPRRILDCASLHQPRERSGLSTVAVLTMAIDGPSIEPTSSAGLVAAGDTIYASTDRLVVTTSPWGAWFQPFFSTLPAGPQEITTDLHSFDITDPAATRYVASGTIEGTLLNQFAISERGGVVRVATTTRPEWVGGGESSSSLVTFVEDGDALVELGRLDGLGVTEQIYAVRFLGEDLAAVVTFRQVDPLYLIDLSDPATPRLLGELKIPGFSSYLHPVGEGRLLGVGQDADEETGRTLGLQVSLFDIDDLANPQRIAQVAYGDGYSPVEYDHRAFLFWPATGQAIIPAELYSGTEVAPATETPIDVEPEVFSGALVVGVGTDALLDAGRVTHLPDGSTEGFAPPVVRSIVIGQDLWTISHDSVARHDLASLQRRSLIRL